MTNDLFVGYDLQLEVPIPNDRFSDIESRRKLRAVFNASGRYQLHPLNDEMIERHLNLANGVQNGVIYTLDNVYLMQSPVPQRMTDKGLIIIRAPIHEKVVMRSAQDLRERIPANGFEKCWNELIDEGGYTIINEETGRCYTVSYGKRETGNIRDGKVTIQSPAYYLSIKYLGITPKRYGDFAPKASNQGAEKQKEEAPMLFDMVAKKENEIISEMKHLTLYLKSKRLI